MNMEHLYSIGLPVAFVDGAEWTVLRSRLEGANPSQHIVEDSQLVTQTESVHLVRVDGRLRYSPPDGPVGLPSIDRSSQILAEHMQRPLIKNCPDHQVSIASFNMLLKGFDRKFYYPSVGPELRAWPWRKEQLQRLILGVDADVYCMQEVECSTFSEEMAPWLLDGGYASVDPKDDAKGKFPEMAKTAIFYKQALLQKVWEDHRSRIVLAAFKHLPSDRLLYVASCHLEGAPWEAATRFAQCKKALESIARHQKTVAADPNTCALVFAGDFNESDDGAVCKCLASGGLQKEFRVPSLPDVEITKTDFRHPFGLSDLYSSDAKRWPHRPATFCAPPEESAAWGDTAAFAAVDFVYYSHRALQPVAIREPFSPEQSKATEGIGIPSKWHFSDHVPIGGIFEFSDEARASASTTSVDTEVI